MVTDIFNQPPHHEKVSYGPVYGYEIVTTKQKNNYLVSKPNYHTKKNILENLLAIEIKKRTNI